MPLPTTSPAAAPARPTAPPAALPCPCGRGDPLAQCCLPVAQRLRGAGGVPATPFDEIRATSALLLWSLLAGEAPSGAVRTALAQAARGFWGTALATERGGAAANAFRRIGADNEANADRPGRGGDFDVPRVGPPTIAPAAPAAEQYGLHLFERTWGAADADTRTWLYAALPTFVRADTVIGELALDWLLWDRPWLRHEPGAHWTARCRAVRGRRRIQRTYAAILRSRIGLWRLEEHIPRRGFRLSDRLTGHRTLLHTASDPWPEAHQRLLLARVYSFGNWRLIGGRCLLLDPLSVGRLLDALERRSAALAAPPPHDPRWRPWLKAELIPLIAAEWLSARLAPPPPDRYHGAYC